MIEHLVGELVHFLVRLDSERRPGSAVYLNCPRCHARHVAAETYEAVEAIRVCSRFPVWSQSHTFLVCGECRRALVASVPMADLAGLTPEELEAHIAARIEVGHLATTLLALGMCWVPFLGFVASALAELVNRKLPRWTRTASYAAFVLSTIITLAVVAQLVQEGRGR